MTARLNIPHFIDQIYALDEWVKAFSLPREYRERTSYRQFYDLLKAKHAELGLTPDALAQLNKAIDDKDLDLAWLEYGMTVDSRELLCPTCYEDLPLNYYWMPEYEAVQQAVDDFMDEQLVGQGISGEAILHVVRKHIPALGAGRFQ